MREMSEPKDGIAPTPVWLMLFFFVLAGWSGYYIAKYAGAFRPDVYNEHFVQGAAPLAKPAPVDPMVLGRQTFNVCMQCHQDTGKGIADTYPPLVGSPILLGDPARPSAFCFMACRETSAWKGTRLMARCRVGIASAMTRLRPY